MLIDPKPDPTDSEAEPSTPDRPTNPPAPPPAAASPIMGDLRAGESPILLGDLPAHPMAPRPRGRKLHVSWGYRQKEAGLETFKTPSGWATTPGALLRFFCKLSADSCSPPPVTQRASLIQRERRVQAATRRLAESGI